MIYEYYYEMMEDIERNIYRSMYQGFINHQVIIEISDYDEDRIYDIFEFITYDILKSIILKQSSLLFL